jgi:hypothetical protein
MPYYQFPAYSQQVLWGTIAGEISLQSDLLGLIKDFAKREILLKLDFSKYGELSTNTFIFPQIVTIAESANARIIAFEAFTGNGNLLCGIKLNGNFIQSLSEIPIDTNYRYVSLEKPIELRQLDRLACEIIEANNAANFYFQLIIKLEYSDES